jgi:hypothetical protein
MNSEFDDSIRIEGIEALNKALGCAKAMRFLALIHREPTDYVEISRRLYHGQSIEKIFECGKNQWKG